MAEPAGGGASDDHGRRAAIGPAALPQKPCTVQIVPKGIIVSPFLKSLASPQPPSTFQPSRFTSFTYPGVVLKSTRSLGHCNADGCVMERDLAKLPIPFWNDSLSLSFSSILKFSTVPVIFCELDCVEVQAGARYGVWTF